MIIGTPIAHNAQLPLDFIKSLLQVKQYTYVFQEGPNIGANRNELFERARFENENILMIDSDMVFKPADVEKMRILLERYDVVTGMCVMSFQGYPLSVFKKNEVGAYKPMTPPTTKLFEIDGCGSAFLGISKKIIETLTEPFTPIEDKKTGQFYGEDISFCKRVQESGFKLWCDPSLNIGHIKTEIKYGKT